MECAMDSRQGDTGTSYGVFYFRKNIDLAAKPAMFKVHVSADNRYKLYVNGTLVSLGPARGDTYYWNYETLIWRHIFLQVKIR
jgi:alpha-L-rhamnosidase